MSLLHLKNSLEFRKDFSHILFYSIHGHGPNDEVKGKGGGSILSLKLESIGHSFKRPFASRGRLIR